MCVLFAVRTSVRNADWRDDLTLFSAAAHASPSSAKAAFNLGNAFRDEGNDTAALDGYDRALAIYPEYVEVYYNQGVLYQRQKNHGLALAAYRKATDYDPDHVNALANIGILLARSGNADGAIIQLERAIAVSPDRGDIYYNLGLVLERKDRRGAIAAYQEALRVVPGYEDAAVNLAMIYRQQGREVEVRSLYRDVLGANPQAYRVAYNLAAELERAGEVDDAIDAYRVAWSAGGEVGAFSRLRMGSLFAKSGKSDSARLSLLEFKADWKGDPRHGETADRLLEHLK